MGKTDPVLEIDYKNLGTIKLDELKQAIWEDIQMLRDEFGVSFVTGVKLVVPATNEYGDPLLVKRLSTGATGKAPRHASLSSRLSRLQTVGGMNMKQPCYIGLEEARQVLAGMGVNSTNGKCSAPPTWTRRDGASCRSSSIRSSTS